MSCKTKFCQNTKKKTNNNQVINFDNTQRIDKSFNSSTEYGRTIAKVINVVQ